MLKNKYPIYVISKGRFDSRLTIRALERMGVEYNIVIEPQEHDQYSKVIDSKKILVLPFSNLGKGSIPARNWVWEHSIEAGFKRHWILDDNIQNFYRFNKNTILIVNTPMIFKACEDFTARFVNVPMSGMNYEMFVHRRVPTTPFRMNTRVYSCILLSNNVPHRWRGRYNEDTDLSLRFLKDGYCTILFNAFLADKTATMTMKGGNSDQLYEQNKDFDGRLEMAKSLYRQHPDVVKIGRRWGRWQHVVDYRPFKRNKLRKRKDVVIKKGIDNYGMVLKKKKVSK